MTVSLDRQEALALLRVPGRQPVIAFPLMARGTVAYDVKLGVSEVAAVPTPLAVSVDSAKGKDVTVQAEEANLTGGKVVILKRVGIMRENVVYSLLIYPLRYDPAARRLTFFKSIDITLASSDPFPDVLEAISKPRARSPGRSAAALPQQTSGEYIRIVVDEDGIYRVRGSDLDTAGVALSGFNADNLTLWNRGKQIPIYIGNVRGASFTKESYFEFYGTSNRAGYSENRPDLYLDPYSDENVYFLTADSTAPVQRLVTESGAIGKWGPAIDLSNYSFTQSVHLEKDLKYERLDAVGTNRPYDRQDHWFWTEVSSRQLIRVPFQLSYPDTTSMRPLTMTAAFQGITHFNDGSTGLPDIPNEHKAELFINNDRVLEAVWDGQARKIVKLGTSANTPQSALHNGTNAFQVYDSDPGSIAVATLALNWVELDYQRLYVADNDYLEFTIPDNAQPGYYRFLIRNFRNSSISVYRLNNSKIADVTIKKLDVDGTAHGYSAMFEAYVQSPADKFIAVSDEGRVTPVRIEKVPDAHLSSRDYSSDYIIIANRQIAGVPGDADADADDNPVNKLASWYDSHGISTLVVDAVQVYDDFSYGIRSPYAIRRFISYAYHNWSVSPRYVLLAGAGSLNTKTSSQSSNLIPVMMMQTYGFGAAASDNFYACVDGDDPIPDVALGRIPATDREQLGAVVDKILSYYAAGNYGWQNTVTLVGGEEKQFHTQVDSIVHSVIPSRYFIKRLYTSIPDPAVDTKYYGLTRDLVNDFDEGTVLLNYMGHGGGAIWADNGILTNDEVSSLSNEDKYPFVTSMTCFTGAFDGQVGHPLSSTLLFAPRKGAVGVLASAGLGWMYNDYYLVREILPILFDSACSENGVGLNIALAKANYYATYSLFWPQAESMVNQYNLIGDPALRLRLPGEAMRVAVDSYTASPGQKISGTIAGGPAGGEGTVQLTDASGDPDARTSVKLDNAGSASFRLAYGGDMAGPICVKAYAYNNSAHSSASAFLSTSGSFVEISGFKVTPVEGLFHIRINALASCAHAEVGSIAFNGEARGAGTRDNQPPKIQLRIPLQKSSSDEFTCDYTVGADSLQPGDIVTGKLVARFTDGTADSTGTHSYTVPGASDVSALPRGATGQINSSIEVVADSLVRLQATVYNWNSNPAENVRVDFWDGNRDSGTLIRSVRISFDTSSRRNVSIPSSLSAGNHAIHICIVFDSLSNGYDLNPKNNLAWNTVKVDLVAADYDGILKLDSTASLSGAAPGDIFRVRTLLPQLYPQPLLMPARDSNGYVRYCQFSDLTNSRKRDYRLFLTIVGPDSTTEANLSSLRLYRYESRTRTLNLAGGGITGDVVSANVDKGGIFTAAYSSDRTPPQVTISVCDQFFTNGDFVPPNPRFSILMHDEDAVDLREGSVTVSLDDQPVDPSLITIPDSVYNPTSVTAAVQVPVKDGSHTIRFTAKDANGNLSDPVVADFIVRPDFSLHVFGSYPNPFVNRTFIAFEITSGNPVDAVTVKIYTVSGRLVKTIRFPSTDPMESIGLLQGGTGSPTAVGYHEAWWDGVDNFGNPVANGVYFYKVSVRSGGKTLEEIGKMARLR